MNGLTYIVVVLGILLAKGLGFFRDIVFASVFGASTQTDMYFQIFGLVNLIFTGVGVALSTLVIKNLNKPGVNEKAYVSSFVRKTTLVTLCVSALLYVFAEPLVNLLLPGLGKGDMALAVKLMYIMLPSLLFVLIAYIVSGVLQNCRVFFISSIMSLPFNVVIICSLFVPSVSIVTVGIVTTVGWLLHILIQLPSFYKKGYRLFLAGNSQKGATPGIKGKNSELLWIFISNMMFQVCFMIDKAFVSADSGAASTINYASNLFITIASVFVVAMSNVVFPSISKNYEEGNMDYVKKLLQNMIVIMLSIFVPFILVTSCFGENIISLLYERGEFTGELAKTTGILFAVYTLGAFGYVCQELFNKVLYLDGKYVYTVAGTVGVIALKPLINLFAQGYGVIAIAVSTTVLFTLYAVNIALGMRKVMGTGLYREILGSSLKILLSGAGALAVFVLLKFMCPLAVSGKIAFLIPLALCGAVYCVGLWVSGIVKEIINGTKAGNRSKE